MHFDPQFVHGSHWVYQSIDCAPPGNRSLSRTDLRGGSILSGCNGRNWASFSAGAGQAPAEPGFAAIPAKCCATREFGHHDHSGRWLHSGGSTTTRPLPVRTATAPGLRYRNPQFDRLASLRQMRCTSESFVPGCFSYCRPAQHS
jgi:hypothetical protein